MNNMFHFCRKTKYYKPPKIEDYQSQLYQNTTPKPKQKAGLFFFKKKMAKSKDKINSSQVQTSFSKSVNIPKDKTKKENKNKEQITNKQIVSQNQELQKNYLLGKEYKNDINQKDLVDNTRDIENLNIMTHKKRDLSNNIQQVNDEIKELTNESFEKEEKDYQSNKEIKEEPMQYKKDNTNTNVNMLNNFQIPQNSLRITKLDFLGISQEEANQKIRESDEAYESFDSVGQRDFEKIYTSDSDNLINEVEMQTSELELKTNNLKEQIESYLKDKKNSFDIELKEKNIASESYLYSFYVQVSNLFKKPVISFDEISQRGDQFTIDQIDVFNKIQQLLSKNKKYK